MSHRASWTVSSSSSSFPNCSFLLTAQGLVQLAQTILGGVCTGLAGYYGHKYYFDLGAQTAEVLTLFFKTSPLDVWLQVTFFLIVAATFLVNTLCMLVSNVLSYTSASMLSKTFYNVLFHLCAFMLCLSASVILIHAIEKQNIKGYKEGYYYKPFLAAGISGVVNAVLYLASVLLSYRSFRGVV